MQNIKAVRQKIETVLEKEIRSISLLSSAKHIDIFRVRSADDLEYVIKMTHDVSVETEFFMLDYLKDKLPVPKVLHYSKEMLIMDYIVSDWDLDSKTQVDVANHLTKLHEIKDDTYGFSRPTQLGSLAQPNIQNTNWVNFFIEQRLLYMAQKTFELGHMMPKTLKKITKLAHKLPTMIYASECAPPSLIHGDVWSGNILSHGGKVKAFLDPALYYADPEMELAFMTLFNGFGKSFFQRYHDISPIREGFFDFRCDVYKLYPLLAHACMFGPRYVWKADKILKKLL